MTTEQIYTLVNSVCSQAFGSTALTAVDTSSLISLGNTVLASNTNTEAFLNTLAQRIGRTILRFRDYNNKLGNMVLNDFEYGAILQKIKVNMPVAEEDKMYDLTDGYAIDHYVVSKPSVDQKLFVTRTPYQFKITIQRATLKEAFLSESAMGGFISVIFGEVRNAIECSLEDLARVTIATGIAETAGTTREVELLSKYLIETGLTVTADEAYHDAAFLRFAMRVIKEIASGMEDMSELYNDGSVKTFTPKQDQRILVNTKFNYALETTVQYAAFHDEYVSFPDTYKALNFWQAAGTPTSVKIKRPSDEIETTVENVVALIHDRDACGVYKMDEEVLTTPVNAAGAYYNTFWHEKQLRFLDKSENFVIFTLA